MQNETNELFCINWTIRKCPIELQNPEECDATDDDSSTAAGQIILRQAQDLKRHPKTSKNAKGFISHFRKGRR